MFNTFLDAFNMLLSLEGDYSNHPSDPGGETKYGISTNSYPGINVKNLTINGALDIYFRDYWEAGNLSKVNDPICFYVFDCLVHHGMGGGAKLVQKAIGAKQDGAIGPVTRSMLNSVDSTEFSEAILRERIEMFLKLGKREFMVGWLARLVRLEKLILQRKLISLPH